MLLVACLLVLCFSSPLCFAQDAEQQKLTEASLSIRSKLIDLKRNSEVVTEQLTLLSESLQQSQQEAAEWKQTSIQLSDSLMSINEQLNGCYTAIELQKKQIANENIVLTWLIVIYIILLVGKVVGYVLYAKGIKLPRWLDILL